MSLIQKMREKWQARRQVEWPAEPPARELVGVAREVGLDVDSAAKKYGKSASQIITAIWDEGVNRQFIHHCMGESISLMDGFREVARELVEKFQLVAKT